MAKRKEGICPRQDISSMIKGGIITGPSISDSQLQPASLDLRLGDEVTCVRATFLPNEHELIRDTIRNRKLKKYSFALSEDESNVLHKGETYIIKLQESVELPLLDDTQFFGTINPKSTTGRAGMSTRCLVEGAPRFDAIPAGKKHDLYVECTPFSRDVRVKKGTSLNQLRIGVGNTTIDRAKIIVRQREDPILYGSTGNPIHTNQIRFADNGIQMTLDLSSGRTVGYRARLNSQSELDLTAPRGALRKQTYEFWEKIPKPSGGVLFLEPGFLYILATKERVAIPPDLCGTLLRRDIGTSEGSVHYAGFFDPRFGYDENKKLYVPHTELLPGTQATLEIRMDEPVFSAIDAQNICLMDLEELLSLPVDDNGNPAGYGQGMYEDKSNYQHQSGATLGKQFARVARK